MINDKWRCGECRKVEGVDSIQMARFSSSSFLFWKLGKFLRFPLPDLDDLDNLYNEDHHTSQISVKIDVICHHCGKPLCQRHRVLIADDAFAFAFDSDLYPTKENFPEWLPHNIKMIVDRSFTSLKKKLPFHFLRFFYPKVSRNFPKAYHCQNCWQKHHSFSIPEVE